MKAPKTIYVDFNNRINPTTSKFYSVDLDEIAELHLLDPVVATDYDELRFDAVLVGLRPDVGYGIIELVPAKILPTLKVTGAGSGGIYAASGVRELASLSN